MYMYPPFSYSKKHFFVLVNLIEIRTSITYLSKSFYITINVCICFNPQLNFI